MFTLFHHNMCTASRTIRLLLFELNLSVTLIEEREWYRREEFIKLNPAGSIPVLLTEDGYPIVEAYPIIEFLEETVASIKTDLQYLPQTPCERAEVRRLVSWFLKKFNDEVTRPIVRQRVYKREMPIDLGGGAPDSTILRLAKSNIRPHMDYLDWLTEDKNCLFGNNLTYADFAATAAISVLDYLGEIEWNSYPHAKQWYARMKSRPSTRLLLRDQVRGIPPAPHYIDPDF